ncbi:MAG: F0F1 ATP synthase subunit alpha [Lachnospiraceae bacterium]|jgi:F-type H+-transporting ATPase subunit alpha|nr:F0F1 ATP synthase subunit alpha [Lachnospiraceae bacterium]MCH4027549.1 F0F1 ATP synthase subunit alpha [Lachnospiraceae bacterium]MCH4065389.1 F0F1 ATP synthase subunit alpha [Lachnospiraceae bacterium]MCH4111429.1 F0F1 ATP synthase subunit alpha [Lachnospiraceae bacterium]MCI1353025.1 F0F1 ATP synthase subunit alpha [Lachnospiraceae bacterium]
MDNQSSSKQVKATLVCASAPTKEQLASLKEAVLKKYNLTEDELDLRFTEDPSVGGGFILRVGSDEYDWSTKGRERQFRDFVDRVKDNKTAGPDDIISILKGSADEFNLRAKSERVGTVERVGDGIARITGIDYSMYGEVLTFESGVKGMVQDVKEDSIGAILFGRGDEVGEGDRVVRTKKRAGVPVGDEFIGRVINALGEPIDGKGRIREEDYLPIEQPAPGIVDRKSVSEPLETGILAIDSMFPIGRGQRELIIGDRQTGKTSIAMDTIINQKGKNCICIYCAIGQKASSVAHLVQTLTAAGAMEYTIVCCTTAAESAALQYIAPYSATSLAEFFMHKGQDVLIVYDDLSKHAVAYRALSLLLGRSPGREAYPGDVFYLHSRLLERSSRLSDKLGGGSITALPIIETQDGDVSAYIPTNVISITDGQIFLETDLFFAGQRPAINVGLSVSRVGGAAQKKAMKKACGSLRIDLAQYREMAVFTEFSSDLDKATQDQLTNGRVLMELLKQPLGHPLSMADEVITLVVGTNRIMMDVEPAKVKEFQNAMLSSFRSRHPEIVEGIRREGNLTDDMKESILKYGKEFHDQWMAEQSGEEKAAGKAIESAAVQKA